MKRLRLLLVWTLILSLLSLNLACAGPFRFKRKSTAPPGRDAGAVRYRLQLRDNPVDSEAAFRCFGACQPEETPDGYVDCLRACPGFEVDSGYACTRHEVPPVAACFTARKVPATDEVPPGYIVLSVLASVAVIVALSSVCGLQSTSAMGQCNGYNQAPLPPQ